MCLKCLDLEDDSLSVCRDCMQQAESNDAGWPSLHHNSPLPGPDLAACTVCIEAVRHQARPTGSLLPLSLIMLHLLAKEHRIHADQKARTRKFQMQHAQVSQLMLSSCGSKCARHCSSTKAQKAGSCDLAPGSYKPPFDRELRTVISISGAPGPEPFNNAQKGPSATR